MRKLGSEEKFEDKKRNDTVLHDGEWINPFAALLWKMKICSMHEAVQFY